MKEQKLVIKNEQEQAIENIFIHLNSIQVCWQA